MLWMSSPYSIKHVQVIRMFNFLTSNELLIEHMKSLHPQMPRRLKNGSYIELISFIFLPTSSFIFIASFTIFIAIYTVHLNRVYDKANLYTGGWGTPILTYHMIDQLSRSSKFNDRQKVKNVTHKAMRPGARPHVPQVMAEGDFRLMTPLYDNSQ